MRQKAIYINTDKLHSLHATRSPNASGNKDVRRIRSDNVNIHYPGCGFPSLKWRYTWAPSSQIHGSHRESHPHAKHNIRDCHHLWPVSHIGRPPESYRVRGDDIKTSVPKCWQKLFSANPSPCLQSYHNKLVQTRSSRTVLISKHQNLTLCV
jgi:hypothetical protein